MTHPLRSSSVGDVSYMGWGRGGGGILISAGEWCEPILVAVLTNIRLLLCFGIKVADEWQISLDYVRGSNIYVRRYLDLRAWSLRLRT